MSNGQRQTNASSRLPTASHDTFTSELNLAAPIPDRTRTDTTNGPPPLGDDADSDEDMDDDGPVAAAASGAAAAGSQPPPPPRTHSHGGGDVVLFLDLPETFTVGYDALSFTARHFGGVRDVSPGPHFFWAAAYPDDGGMSTRSGFWIVSSGSATDRVHAVKWDRGSELLVDAPREEIPTDVDAFHGKLLSYRDPTAGAGAGGGGGGGGGNMSESQVAENERIWGQMTGFVTKTLLSRVVGGGQRMREGTVWHINTMDRVQGAILQSGEREMEQRIAGGVPLLPLPDELRFSLDQHAKTYSAARFGADRTLEATDATSYMLSLLDRGSIAPVADGSDAGSAVTEAGLVGELQLAFVAGVHLGNEACLEQWWYMLLRLVLRAYALPLSRPSLVADWLRAVTAQLTYGSEWLDTPLTELSEQHCRALRLALIVYKRRLEELLDLEPGADDAGSGSSERTATTTTTTTTGLAEVATAFSRLESVVAGPGFGWDLRGEYLRKGKVVMEDGEEVELEMKELQAEDERGEWAPEIVELDEHGRQKDLISWND